MIMVGLKRSSERLAALNDKMRESGKYWMWFKLLRQCITLVILIEGRDLGSFQILALLVFSIFSLSLALKINPYKCQIQNYFTFMNEFAVSIYLYLMLLLSYLNIQEEDGIIGLKIKNWIGWALFSLLSGVVLINLIKALINDYKVLKLKIIALMNYLKALKLKIKNKFAESSPVQKYAV
jgi:hypothetical protein